jgi:hypothetical protein
MVRVLHSFRRVVQRTIGKGSALSLGFLLLAGGVAVASIPDSSGVINGCWNKTNGNLRVIDTANDSCRTSEIAISWNETGPQGPQGPQGPAGPPGPPGLDRGSAAYSVVNGACGGGGGTGFFTNGGISGTFNAPALAPGHTGCGSASFQMSLNWSFQNLTGPGAPIAVGSGTALCDPCTVAGVTGTLNFALTVAGLASVDASGVPNGVNDLGGTWTIIGAAGGLAGLTGQGTYSSSATAAFVFIGTVT